MRVRVLEADAKTRRIDDLLQQCEHHWMAGPGAQATESEAVSGGLMEMNPFSHTNSGIVSPSTYRCSVVAARMPCAKKRDGATALRWGFSGFGTSAL